MIIAYVPMLTMVLGLVLFLIAARGDVKEVGRVLFAVGLLVTLWHLSGATIRIG